MLAPAASCFSICSPSPGPPADDSCDSPSSAGVATVEIGGYVDLNADHEPFVALHDGDPEHVARGGQGFAMIPVRLRVTGSDPPACLSETTRVLDDQGDELAAKNTPVATYAEDDGSRTTKPIYLIIGYAPAGAVHVIAMVGDRSASVWLGGPVPDAGVDGGASVADLSVPPDLSVPSIAADLSISPPSVDLAQPDLDDAAADAVDLAPAD